MDLILIKNRKVHPTVEQQHCKVLIKDDPM